MKRQSIPTIINKLKPTVVVLEFLVLTVLILYIGKSLFISLGFAFLISIVLYPLCQWFENKGIPRTLAISIPFFFMISIFIGLGYLLFTYVLNVVSELDQMKLKLQELIQKFNLMIADKLGFNAEKQTEVLQQFIDNFGSNLFADTGGKVLTMSENLFFLVMIPIFAFLILLYRHKLTNALYGLFLSNNRKDLSEIVSETIKTYYNFIRGMLLIYLIVGVLNSIGLAVIGVPNPILFGFIVSVFTFIPYFGIIISSLLPITVAWMTYDSVWYPVAVIAWFAIVQILEAYLIFPLIIGKRLQVNILVMFMMIILGGMLWGAAGMILFIPIVSLVKIMADKSDNLKFISELLKE
jgi:predicted PurR-regulated permease PerM